MDERRRLRSVTAARRDHRHFEFGMSHDLEQHSGPALQESPTRPQHNFVPLPMH